ncbi:unnamed protein product [Cladocopium goreaui]|uniref:Poly A polymerase head domain-containing protein n=1 Tax=Cladocopium goreaui TaxID=2562237 RepID=A0A9P1C1P7_9DINO|nr:unnamed protein product [Cladocopium goreaui]
MLELPGIRRGLIVPIPSSRHLPPRPVKPNHFVVRRTASPVKKPGLSLTERACLATMAAVAAKRIAVHHGEKLPDEYACRIPKTDSEILNFFLSFLAHQGLTDVPVFVNGGYVRDLLLGKEPDDLDLTLCLRDCPEEVTVAALLDEMKGYVESRPELGITEFKNATILSNESKDKQLDTFKAHFTNKDGVKTEVDVMPTIGEEKYSEDNRIPERDQRGLPEEDALRRDLTIGALLLRVQRSAAAGDGSDAALEYELFDFYGGVRKPELPTLLLSPVNKTVEEVAEIVLRLLGSAFLQAFCNWQPTRLLPRHLDRGPRRSAEGRGADADGKEIVYNYFSQDYALITRKEKAFDPGQWLSELLPWSAGELKARDAIDEVLPKWRDLEVGPRTEEALRRRFRALTGAAGGEEAALAAMKKNIAVMYFAEGQIQSAGEVLQRKLGKERASEVIQKNPGALTIDPKNLESNIAAVCLAADAVNVIVSNAEVSRFAAGGIGLFFAIGLGKATFDVIALRAFSG